MRPVAIAALMLLGAALLRTADAAQVTLTWDAPTGTLPQGITHSGYMIQGCTPPATGVCLPGDLPGGALPAAVRTYVDKDVSPGTKRCYGVVALYTPPARSVPEPTPVPLCVTLPPAPALPAPASMHMVFLPPSRGAAKEVSPDARIRASWTAPVFTPPTTVPASALTGYAVWRRTEGTWAVLAEVSPTTLSYDDEDPMIGSNCYATQALYGTAGASPRGPSACGEVGVPAVIPPPVGLRATIP